MSSKYLPIGSVVRLHGGTRNVMISGFCCVSNSGEDKKVYDYNGCIYPEGILNSNEMCLFNNSQIETVVFRGFEDDQEIKFKKELEKNMSNVEEDITISISEEAEKVQNPTFSINDSIFN